MRETLDLLTLLTPSCRADSSKHAVKNPFIYSHLVAWLGDGLLLSYGAKWKSRRHLITPSFHSDILKSFVDVMQEQTDVFVDVLRQKSREGKPFDIFEPITLCALDIINETAMGAKIDGTCPRGWQV